MLHSFRWILILSLVPISWERSVLSPHPSALPSNSPAVKRRPFLNLQVGHSGPIQALAFSPDGKMLATGSDDNTARLWDMAGGQVKTLQGDALCVSFAPDGRTLATAGLDTAVRLWDVTTAQLKATLQGHAGPVGTLAFSPDGKTLATSSTDKTVRLWDVATAQPRATLQGHSSPQKTTPLAFSPDGKILATGSRDDEMVRLWDVASAQLKVTLQGHNGPVDTLAFSPDGMSLATGSWDHTAMLWDVASSHSKAILKGHEYSVETLAFSPDGKTLATGSSDKTARLWDVASGQSKAILKGHTYNIFTVAFSPDGKTLATGSRDYTARLWDVATGQSKATLQGHKGPVYVLVFSPDSKTLVTGDVDGTVRLWDVSTGQIKITLQGRANIVHAAILSRDGKTLAVGSTDGTARLWDVAIGQIKLTLQGHKSLVSKLAFSPDGKTLATGSWDTTARLWDVASGQSKATLEGHFNAVGTLAFSPDGKMLATGSSDNTARLWDVASAQARATLKGHTRSVDTLVFSPDGKTLATGSRDTTVRLWDVTSGQVKATLEGHLGPVYALAFSPDGQTLATGSSDKTARLWDGTSGQVKAILRSDNDKDLPATVTFSPDGKTLAVGYMDGTTRLWDVANGQVKAILQGHKDPPAIAFSPDGKMLATRSYDTVLLWDAATGKQLPIASPTNLANFPNGIQHPWTAEGASLSLHDPRDGRVLATMLAIPEIAEETARARPIRADARPIRADAKAASPDSNEWFVTTPEGYFDCSANAARFIKWNVNGVLYPAERYIRRFRRPDLVRKALRGEKIDAPEISGNDIPPVVRFVKPVKGDMVGGESVEVTVEANSDRDFKEVDLLVNGRPLPTQDARPIRADARPITTEANRRIVKQFTFRVPLPRGAERIDLRAIAYDDTDLGSEPAEISVNRLDAKPVGGNLYVLSVGVSRYKNGSDQSSVIGNQGINNLRFSANDARVIAERFNQEGNSQGLYQHVQVRTLTDDQATLANVRASLKWLQDNVRPGQMDTSVIFLSGHGVSLDDGSYYFATHDIDLKNIRGTSLSGKELRRALGGELQARAVFLFVDTCHSGGLNGRNDDLAIEVGEGVYLLASSGAKEYSYESEKWEHGAFTLALLRALNRKELASSGVIHFNALTYAVPDAVADLMRESGRNESEQEPCVPLAARRLRVPIAHAVR